MLRVALILIGLLATLSMHAGAASHDLSAAGVAEFTAAYMEPRRLKFMSLWIVAAHFVDLYWLVMPTYAKEFSLAWIELGFPLVAVGVIIVLLSFLLKRTNLVPVGDPKLQRGLDFRL